MSKRYLLVSVLTVLLAALALVACGGGGSDSCGAPLMLTPGTWCITLTNTVNNCGAPLDPIPYTADFTQNASDLSAVSEFGHMYAGTICGNTATMTGNNEGISTTINLTFSDASNAAGSVHWNTGTCSGTDTFISTAGSCQ